MNKFLTACCFVLLLPVLLVAQKEQRINQQLKWKNNCYDMQVRNIQFFKGDNELALPVYTLGMNEYLTLWFDDLSVDRSSLRYTIVHCTADWEEDNLFVTDYLDGFPENWLNDFTHSHIARVGYTHYELQVPNDNVRLKISGNYLLKVYTESASEPLFVQGFSVIEPKTSAALNMRSLMQSGDACLQQLEITVTHPQLDVRNAFRELKLRVEQNGARVPGAEQPTPAFIDNGSTNFSQIDRNWYPGGNEFRFFDTRSLDMGRRGVVQISSDNSGFMYALLQTDKPRERQYFYDRDMNGRYKIEANRTKDRLIEAEYVTTIFTLSAPAPFDGDVYVFGGLTDFSLRPDFRMEYNEQRGAYELNALVKQGIYNYRYVLVNRNGTVDWNAIEGCFAETENTYNVYVYFRGARDRYDRLVGLFTLNTTTR